MRARRSLFPLALLLTVTALLALPACRGCNADTKAHSDAGVSVAQGIPVNIDGKEIAPIDLAQLARVTPDFTEGERRAWKLRSLLGEPADRPGTIIEIEDGEGVKTVLSRVGEAKDGREVVFAVNRLGEARVAIILPAEPFPSFHGRGGNRGRGGDPTRIREVRKIWLRHGDPGAGAPEGGR